MFHLPMWHGLIKNFSTEICFDPSEWYFGTSAICQCDLLDGSFAYRDLFMVLYCRGYIILQYSGMNRNEQIIGVNVPG